MLTDKYKRNLMLGLLFTANCSNFFGHRFLIGIVSEKITIYCG